MKSFAVILAPFALLVNSVASTNQLNQSSQVAPEQALSHLEATLRDAEKFSLDLLTQMSKDLEDEDFLISPYSLWSLLILLAEAGDFVNHMLFLSVLHQKEDLVGIRKTFNEVAGAAEIKSSSIEVAKWQAMFADINQFVKGDYIKLLNTSYSTEVQNLDFNNIQSTTDHINNAIKLRTNGFIESPITADHVRDAKLLMTSTLYLKGRWQFSSDEKLMNKKVGNETVNFMPRKVLFRCSDMRNLEAIVTELPIGNEGRLSMLVLQPHEGVSGNQVIRNLRMIGLKPVFEHLKRGSLYSNGTNTIVPKFSARMDFSLGHSLENLGLYDAFVMDALNLVLEGAHFEDIRHRSIISVNEEGIEAVAVDSAIFQERSARCRVFNDKSLLYLIVDPLTNFIHLAVGKGRAIY